MERPVICGVDGSGSARQAIEVARDMARRYDAPLLYVHVVEGPGGEERALETLRDADVASGTLLVERGHPADRLVALAAERDASLLVVGNHGPRSSLLGSISADVARRAPCPVVVVPPAPAGDVFVVDRPRPSGGSNPLPAERGAANLAAHGAQPRVVRTMREKE
ncbi:MAG TPA: universal stress protein [Gaiellaceae bacterium]|jgi:nucleotide-binding universal stress UspA family protein